MFPSAAGCPAIAKRLNMNFALGIDPEIHPVNQTAIAALLFIATLGHLNPFAISNVIVAAFGHRPICLGIILTFPWPDHRPFANPSAV